MTTNVDWPAAPTLILTNRKPFALARPAILNSSTFQPALAKPPPLYSHGFGTVFNFKIRSGRVGSFIAWQFCMTGVCETSTSLTSEEIAYVRRLQNPYAGLNFVSDDDLAVTPTEPEESSEPPANQTHESRYNPQSR